jgi:ribosomal protein L11 methyltransferase
MTRHQVVVVVDVPAGGTSYDRVVDVLWQNGPTAVSETELGEVPEQATDSRTDARVRLTAAFEDPAAAANAHTQLAQAGAQLMEVDAGDWLANWRSTEPTWAVGGFLLRLPEHRAGGDELVELVIEPSTTFGFSHASTRLALELLVDAPITGAEVADIGCGSGVLGIAAAKRGAASVTSVDLDPHAVAMTMTNAETNDVQISAHVGSTELLTDHRFDLVLMNVTAGTSFPMAHAVAGLTRSGGTLILSGLLATQRRAAIDAFSGFDATAEKSEGDWLALRLRRLG